MSEITLYGPGHRATLEEGLGVSLRKILGFEGRYLAGRGTTRAEDAQWTSTQSHISPSILVYEDHIGVQFGLFSPNPCR